MGQRHQIYVRIKGKVIGLHHQWLYGQQAIDSLNRLMVFLSVQDRQYCKLRRGYEDPSGIIQAIYSADWTSGYYHSLCDLKDEPEVIADPRKGDNNDGITIIDLDGDEPKYCFMNIGHLECSAAYRDSVPLLTPISASDYLRFYYPVYDSDPSADNREFNLKSQRLLASLANFEVLSPETVKEVFPKMPVKGCKVVALAPKAATAPKKRRSKLQPWQVGGGK